MRTQSHRPGGSFEKKNALNSFLIIIIKKGSSLKGLYWQLTISTKIDRLFWIDNLSNVESRPDLEANDSLVNRNAVALGAAAFPDFLKVF